MLTAPFVAPAPSNPSTADPVEEPSEVRDYASRRLEDTVWDRGVPIALYRRLLRLGGALCRLGVTANSLTGASVVFAVFSAVAIVAGEFIAGAVLIVISGTCDALDGAVARASGTSSRYGALLDSTVDRLADALPLLGVTLFYAGSPLVAVPTVALMGAFLVSYVRARAEGLGGELPPLFMRRAERVVLLVVTLVVAPLDVGGVLSALGPWQVSAPAPLLLVGVALLGLMSFFGVVSALRSARIALAAPRDGVVSEPSE